MPVSQRLKLMDASPQLGSTELFVAAGVSFNVDDAIASAIFRGALDDAIGETLALAYVEDHLQDGDEPEDADLQASSEKFRYEHELISAGETEEWLEARGMNTGDFGAWLFQRLCRSMVRVVANDGVPDDFPDLLRIHLWLSDQMEALTEALSRRVAAGLEIADPAGTGPVMRTFLTRHHLDDDSLAGWLETLDRDRSWLNETVRREAAFERLAESAATDDARARRLSSMAMSLARVELDTLALGSEAAAREAVLCVHDDGLSLSEVALETGYRAERKMLWIDEMEDRLAHRVLPAAEGAVIGPIAHEGRFEVLQILRKLKPSLTDPAVTRRIDSVIVKEFFDDLCARHIHR